MEIEILDMLPPHNLEAEKSVIGGLLLDHSYYESLDNLKADDFYSCANRTLYSRISEIIESGKPFDLTILVDSLKRHSELDEIGGLAYLSEVGRSVAVAAHTARYAEIVARDARARSLIHLATETLSEVYDHKNPDEIVNFVESSLSNINTTSDIGRPVTAAEAGRQAYAELQERAKRGQWGGLPTGVPSIDAFTGGLFKGEMTVVAGATGIGKTSLALQCASHNADMGKTTYFVSLEMRHTELANRLACARTGISSQKIRLGGLSPKEISDLGVALMKLSDKLWIHPPGPVNVGGLAREARKLSRKDLGLVVVDYIGLIRAVRDDGKKTRQEVVAEISHALKELTRSLGIPVLVLAQFNRGVVDKFYRPRLTELKESSAIEQDADVVWFIRAKKRGDENSEFNAVLDVMKCRNGETGPVHLEWVAPWTKFCDEPHTELDPSEYPIQKNEGYWIHDKVPTC